MPNHVLIFIVIAVGFWGTLGQAQTSNSDPIPSSMCDFLISDLKIRNCQFALGALDFNSHPIPNFDSSAHPYPSPNPIENHEAISFTLKYFKDNLHGLKDPSCALKSESVANKVLTPDQVKAGIQNDCQFVLNDLNRPWPAPCPPNTFCRQSTAYFVDLCAEDPNKIVQKFYMNKGRPGFLDIDGQKSTLAGCFLTSNEPNVFPPFAEYFHNKGYDKLRKDGNLWGLNLVGLNSSNSHSEYLKPIHVTPFMSSTGCPSIGVESLGFLKALGAHKPSLLVNYGPQKFHQSTENCNNTGGNHAAPKPGYSEGGAEH